MKSFGLVSIGALALAGTAYAQVPASNDTSTSDGNQNTGMGSGALGGPTPVNLTGTHNTASGFEALLHDTTGSANTASGDSALFFNTTGFQNTASGFDALANNTTGDNNAAFGDEALFSNTTGDNNAAFGHDALLSNTAGFQNTASGVNALLFNTTGNNNTASGYSVLYSNQAGADNTASGYEALYANSSGSNNTASGVNALFENTTGNDNTASGQGALKSNTTGSTNIAMGYLAGLQLTTGSHNIDIGNQGAAGESGTIRIGTGATQKATFIAGIKGVSVTGSAVMVSSTGQLGVTVSSERFKTAIEPMGSNTAKLQQLRPVMFHLKTDPKGALQYGLIAEEVAKVYPDLVIRDEKGRIDGVRYDELAPMLLNEVQQQRTQMTEKIDAQAAEIRDLKQQMAELKALNQATQVALRKLQAKDEFVARR
jgi:Chaperone of endosialidase